MVQDHIPHKKAISSGVVKFVFDLGRITEGCQVVVGYLHDFLHAPSEDVDTGREKPMFSKTIGEGVTSQQ
jgi:hypothetical protein